MKKKNGVTKKHSHRESKVPPETVLQKLEKKKARLAKKLEEPRDPIKKPKQYKKRRKSYEYGIENLSAQIEDTKELLTKSLKKRPIPESLEKTMAEEGEQVKRLELIRSLREKVSNIAKDRRQNTKDGDGEAE